MPSHRQQPIIITGAVLAILIQPIAWSNVPLDRTSSRSSIKLHFNSKALTDPPTLGTDIQYTPPNRGAPEITASGGTRLLDIPLLRTDKLPPSCSESLAVPLVPQNHVGQTISGRPTFFWYLSDKVLPTNSSQIPKIEFALKQKGKDESLFTKEIAIDKTGIIQFVLPNNQPELKAGQDYLWSVSVVCYDSQNEQFKKKVVEASIRRVAPLTQLTAQLSSVTSQRQRARIYAQNGFWYDGIEALSRASTSEPNQQSIYEEFFSLLNQVGLKQVTDQMRQNQQS